MVSLTCALGREGSILPKYTVPLVATGLYYPHVVTSDKHRLDAAIDAKACQRHARVKLAGNLQIIVQAQTRIIPHIDCNLGVEGGRAEEENLYLVRGDNGVG